MNSQPAPITALNHTLDNEPQQITAPLTHSAAFLVLKVKDDEASIARAREVLASTDDLIKNTAIREIERTFTCNVAIGHRVAAAGGLHAAARAEAVPRDQGRHSHRRVHAR